MEPETIDVHAAVHTQMDSAPSTLGKVGMAVLGLGILSLIVGVVTFLVSYPDPWYAGNAAANWRVELTLIFLALGIIGILFGTALSGFSRSVVGQGGTEYYEAAPTVETAAAPETEWQDDAWQEPAWEGEPAWDEPAWDEPARSGSVEPAEPAWDEPELEEEQRV